MIQEPRFVKEGWLDNSKPYEGWKLKKDAPECEWARIEFEEWLRTEPTENERIRIY